MPGFPISFKTKLMFYHTELGGGESPFQPIHWYNSHSIYSKREVDEYYDGKRELGKLVIRDQDGQVVELYARPREGYYIIHRGKH